MSHDLSKELKRLYDATELFADEAATPHVRKLAEGLDALAKIVETHRRQREEGLGETPI